MSAPEAPSFTPELFAFLRELEQRNEREWFNANKGRYERDLKEPALAFVEDFGYRLPQVAPHLTADKRSLFRIYRDRRWSPTGGSPTANRSSARRPATPPTCR